jgi:hypothetical protein
MNAINAARTHRKFHAVIRMINEFGLLRKTGIDKGDLGPELDAANVAIWKAYHALKAKVGPYTCPVCGVVREDGWPCGNYCVDPVTTYFTDKAQTGQPQPQPR